MVQQDPWEHATLLQSTRAHSVWATALCFVRSSMWSQAKGQAHCETSSLCYVYKKGGGPPCTNCPSDARLLFRLAYNQLNIR